MKNLTMLLCRLRVDSYLAAKPGPLDVELGNITLYIYPGTEMNGKTGTFIKATLSGGFLDMFFVGQDARAAFLEYRSIAEKDYYYGTSGILDGTIDLLSPCYRNKYNDVQWLKSNLLSI